MELSGPDTLTAADRLPLSAGDHGAHAASTLLRLFVVYGVTLGSNLGQMPFEMRDARLLCLTVSLANGFRPRIRVDLLGVKLGKNCLSQ